MKRQKLHNESTFCPCLKEAEGCRFLLASVFTFNESIGLNHHRLGEFHLSESHLFKKGGSRLWNHSGNGVFTLVAFVNMDECDGKRGRDVLL